VAFGVSGITRGVAFGVSGTTRGVTTEGDYSNQLSFLSVVLITKMLEICIHTSYDQNVQLIFKSYLPVVYGTPSNFMYGTTLNI
jgi:hypothetical protein